MAGSDIRSPFESRHADPLQRFLAQVSEQCDSAGLRTAQDFIRHFPPRALMEALVDEPELRAKILVEAVGVRERIALKKTPESCAEDLDISLEEGETDAATIVGFVGPDERAQYLDPVDLWAYVTEPRVWQTNDRDETAIVTARQHVAFVLDRALAENLLSPKEIVEGITVAALVEYLPKVEVAGAIEAALAHGRAETPFSDESLLDAIPISLVAEHVPLPLLWDSVVLPKIAAKHELVAVDGAGPEIATAATSKPLFDASDAHPDAREVEVMIDDIQVESGPINVEEIEEIEPDAASPKKPPKNTPLKKRSGSTGARIL